MKISASCAPLLLAFFTGCGGEPAEGGAGTAGGGGAAAAGDGFADGDSAGGEPAGGSSVGGHSAGGSATVGAPAGDAAAGDAASPMSADAGAGEAEAPQGVPCGDGWGTAPIPGSVELGLASSPEIPGVPGGLPEERAIFDQINAQREEHGLEPLSWSEQVANVARSHSADMNQLDYFDHGSSVRPYRDEDGNAIRANWLPRPRLEHVYPGHFSRAGENLARHRNPVDTVVDAWMNSPGHRAAILDEYGWTATHGAIGIDGRMVTFVPAVCAVR